MNFSLAPKMRLRNISARYGKPASCITGENTAYVTLWRRIWQYLTQNRNMKKMKHLLFDLAVTYVGIYHIDRSATKWKFVSSWLFISGLFVILKY